MVLEVSDEAHIPAQQSRAQAAPWFPRPHGDRGWPQGAPRPPRARPQQALGLNETKAGFPDDPAQIAIAPLRVLTRRADFVAANQGIRVARPGFVLLVRSNGGEGRRYGVTVTKRIGNAVTRNRMKRRFRALLREVLPANGQNDADHVLIGREGGIERDFALLREELLAALSRSAKGKGDRPRRAGRGDSREPRK
jgi:ribonuclease P protein component